MAALAAAAAIGGSYANGKPRLPALSISCDLFVASVVKTRDKEADCAKPRAPTINVLSTTSLLVYGLNQQSPPDGSGAKLSKLQLATGPWTVIAPPEAAISLKCQLPPTPQPAIGNLRIAPELAPKVMWYLNGVAIHSGGPQDIYYNFTLGKSKQNLLGLLSCAHHILSPESSPDNFDGGQMRVLASSNQIDLRLKVGPALVAKRELMPAMRSFSELELNANLASKLRLVCLAQCEPICSIDWYLNRRPLGAAAVAAGGSTTSGRPQSKWGHRDLQQQQLAANATANAEPIVLSRSWDLDHHDVDGELGIGKVNQVEILNHGAINNSSKSFSWYKSTGSIASSGRLELDATARQLRQEAQETLHHLAPNKANIFSRLELTYSQLSKLLALNDRQVEIKCKLNPLLNGQRAKLNNGNFNNDDEDVSFGHTFVEPMRWFPVELETGGMANDELVGDSFHRRSSAFTNEPLNLTSMNTDRIDPNEATPNDAYREKWNINRGIKSPIDYQGRRLLSSGPDERLNHPNDGPTVDEMQIIILVDRAPKSVSISFGGITSTDQEARGVTITEGQLLELMDPTKELAPTLWCQVPDNPYPKPYYKWTFTDSNRTNHAIAFEGSQLNLRQIIQSRQRQLNIDPASAYGAEVVASVVGNYTCTAGNIHGARSATLPVQIQGRPLCKLTLGSEYLGPDNELWAKLRCLIYSSPLLLETVWFRGNQQLAVNKSMLEQFLEPKSSSVSVVELPIVVLNKQQDFMLMDLMNQLANFKCIARNPLGYSEACELSQADKLTLINTFKPISGGLGSKDLALNIIPSFDNTIKSGSSSLNFLANNTIDFGLSSTGNHHHHPMTQIEHGTSWIFLITICVVVIVVWLLITLIRWMLRRCYSDSSSSKLGSKHNHNTNWRFNPTRTSNNSETMGLPFQSKTVCVNYYGDSNGDSEHDMMQSCSQSSHYEEFVAGQNHPMQQQQPVYFNGHTSTTLTRRTLLKPSLSTSSAGDSSTGSRQAQQLARIGEKSRDLSAAPLSSHQTKLAATMRESLGPIGSHYSADGGRYQSQAGLTLTSNVPLINGAYNSSRINLDQQPNQNNYRYQRDQQTFGLRNEPIYDDVIYNQMIL